MWSTQPVPTLKAVQGAGSVPVLRLQCVPGTRAKARVVPPARDLAWMVAERPRGGLGLGSLLASCGHSPRLWCLSTLLLSDAFPGCPLSAMDV